uniref:Uncharacterized protein n=1 Tax=Arundo donax TaxID=35708 RepID=A0A0A9FRA1_ARUDO
MSYLKINNAMVQFFLQQQRTQNCVTGKSDKNRKVLV